MPEIRHLALTQHDKLTAQASPLREDRATLSRTSLLPLESSRVPSSISKTLAFYSKNIMYSIYYGIYGIHMLFNILITFNNITPPLAMFQLFLEHA